MRYFALRISSFFAIPICAVLTTLYPNITAAQIAPIPVESFFKSSQISDVEFSPDGKSIAMLAAAGNDRLVLSVMETNNLTPKVIAHYEKTDVVFFHWVNNKRLVFGVGDRTLGAAEVQTGNGLFAVNKDGSEFRQLIETHAALASDGSKFRVLNSRHFFPTSVM